MMIRRTFLSAAFGKLLAVFGITQAVKASEPVQLSNFLSSNEILKSFDARVWAEQFIARIRNGLDPTDLAWVTGWFANALMRGYDEHSRKVMPPRELLRAYCGLPKGIELCDLSVSFKHAAYPWHMVRVIHATVFVSKEYKSRHEYPVIDIAFNNLFPLQDGYRRERTLVEPNFPACLKISILDIMVYPEQPDDFDGNPDHY